MFLKGSLSNFFCYLFYLLYLLLLLLLYDLSYFSLLYTGISILVSLCYFSFYLSSLNQIIFSPLCQKSKSRLYIHTSNLGHLIKVSTSSPLYIHNQVHF